MICAHLQHHPHNPSAQPSPSEKPFAELKTSSSHARAPTALRVALREALQEALRLALRNNARSDQIVRNIKFISEYGTSHDAIEHANIKHIYIINYLARVWQYLETWQLSSPSTFWQSFRPYIIQGNEKKIEHIFYRNKSFCIPLYYFCRDYIDPLKGL